MWYPKKKIKFDSEAAIPKDVISPDEAMFVGMINSEAAIPTSSSTTMRLDVITTNACRKFHIDNIVARLVCTYRGTGTQYGIVETRGAEPEQIWTVPTGAPIVMRGTKWPETPASGLRHRSPPIVGADGQPTETRLVLVLDPVFDPEDED